MGESAGAGTVARAAAVGAAAAPVGPAHTPPAESAACATGAACGTCGEALTYKVGTILGWPTHLVVGLYWLTQDGLCAQFLKRHFFYAYE